MTSYRNKYLEMLKTDFGKKPLGRELPKLTEPPFVSFGSSCPRGFSEFSAFSISRYLFRYPVIGGPLG